MTKHDDVKQPYSKWLHNQQTLKDLKRQIEKVGYPLEFATKKVFCKNNYEISNAYYLQPNGKNSSNVWREIDIYSCKRMNDGVYLFAPNVISPTLGKLMKKSWEFPVVIANLKMVERCLHDIEDGLKMMTYYAEEALRMNPLLIYADVMEFIQNEGLQSLANQ